MTGACASSSRTLSVISSASEPGARPWRSIVSATRAGNAALASWRGLVLTHISSGSARGNRCCQPATSRHAVVSTQSPSAPISPESSATGMNSTGSSSPRSGCCQRASASTAATLPSASSTIGW